MLSLYEGGGIDIPTYRDRSKTHNQSLERLRNEVDDLEGELEVQKEKMTTNELKQKVQTFKSNWQKATTMQEQNLLLRSIVSRIHYTREESNVIFEIEYH